MRSGSSKRADRIPLGVGPESPMLDSLLRRWRSRGLPSLFARRPKGDNACDHDGDRDKDPIALQGGQAQECVATSGIRLRVDRQHDGGVRAPARRIHDRHLDRKCPGRRGRAGQRRRVDGGAPGRQSRVCVREGPGARRRYGKGDARSEGDRGGGGGEGAILLLLVS